MSSTTAINNRAAIQTSCLNVFQNASSEDVWNKVKKFASGFFEGFVQGVLISITVFSLAFIIGFGLVLGHEKATEIFGRIVVPRG